MNRLAIFWRLGTERQALRRSLTVGLVVGTLLNLINQGSALWSGQADLPRLLLTFCVPFLVSTYAGVAARLRFDPGLGAPWPARLACQRCGRSTVTVSSGERVPECAECGPKTDWKSDA